MCVRLRGGCELWWGGGEVECWIGGVARQALVHFPGIQRIRARHLRYTSTTRALSLCTHYTF